MIDGQKPGGQGAGSRPRDLGQPGKKEMIRKRVICGVIPTKVECHSVIPLRNNGDEK